MAIPSVVQGTIETEDGKVIELDSPKGSTWLESIGSFRFEPSGANKPYTVRKESGKGGDYWYGYRKVAGKLHKKYIGKSSELSTPKLEEIAEALNTSPLPRVTGKVTEVTEINQQRVTDRVTDARATDRLTALELQVQALQESLEALRSELPGKLKSGDSSELPNPDTEVADGELHIKLGNLEADNEKLKTYYAALLNSSTHVTNKLREEVQELRSQLATERASWEEVEAELSDLKQKSATAGKDLPDAADLLNQLKKAKGKKSSASLADVEAILEMIEES